MEQDFQSLAIRLLEEIILHFSSLRKTLAGIAGEADITEIDRFHLIQELSKLKTTK